MLKLKISFFVIFNCMIITNVISQPLKSIKKNVDSIHNKIRITNLEPLEIKSIRSTDKSPFSFQNLNSKEISSKNIGQDIPYILNQTPSFLSSSNSGTGIGYTNFSIRGTDQTRINVTLNGIPYNDGESSDVFFVDLPDFSSSISSVQIQRGVGTSTNGASAFGASINLSTNELIDSHFLQYNTSAGSFNTYKNTLIYNTNRLAKHFIFNLRLSNINSDGYIERSFSKLQSLYFSGAYLMKKASLKLNILTGHEKTYQAWFGVPEDSLQTHRNYNPGGLKADGTYYPNQIDDYTQTHYQLFYNQKINNYARFNTAFFLTSGNGYYENYYIDSDNNKYGLNNKINFNSIVNQKWLSNIFIGQIFSINFNLPKSDWTFGGGWANYNGRHYNKVVQLNDLPFNNNQNYFDADGIKKDFNIYAKWQYKLSNKLFSLIDLQYKYIDYKINGFEDIPSVNNLFIRNYYNFFNPKIGFTYIDNHYKIFTSLAVAHKEPNRNDFKIAINNQPKAEILYDWETGFSFNNKKFFIATTFYWMQYTDQLILTGQINDVGAYTRINVPKSYRLGIEIESSLLLLKNLTIYGNLNVSQNKIENYNQYVDDYDNGNQQVFSFKNTDIAFSPNLIQTLNIEYKLKNFTFNWVEKYVGKQYLDNTQNNNRTLNNYITNDFKFSYLVTFKKIKSLQIGFQILNIFNELYEPNGYNFNFILDKNIQNYNNYFPNAGRMFLGFLQVGF